MHIAPLNDLQERIERKRMLQDLVREKYEQKEGIFLFFGAFEKDRQSFYQDSNFHYFYGLEEPALIALQEDLSTTLYLPHYSINRALWAVQKLDEELLSSLGIDSVELLGKPVSGYSTDGNYTVDQLETLILHLKKVIAEKKVIFIPLEQLSVEARLLLVTLEREIPELRTALCDISGEVAILRRFKSHRELEYMHVAAEITSFAQQAAAGTIASEKNEQQIQAALEYVFIESGAKKAFCSIVASGKNSTVLHYTENDVVMKKGDLVIIDIGASYHHYCSDITRTYPVSGVFSARQKKVYQDVLDCHNYIKDLVKPGFYLKNKKYPSVCLNTLAHQFLKDRGYDTEKAFPHGVGHYVGLDVHDIGSYESPLQEGDVITIEPGIYLEDEQLGVRLEDTYWVVPEGVVCLTDQTPKEIKDVEQFMKQARFELQS